MHKAPTIQPAELKALRAKAGDTQVRAAYLAHAALRTYVQWEAGDRPMPGSAAAQLLLSWHMLGLLPAESTQPYLRPEIYKLTKRSAAYKK